MGGGSWPGSSSWLDGYATATSATSLTNGSATFPTAGQGLAGAIVAAGPNVSGTGAVVFGVIVSNSTTVLTVDQWTASSTMLQTGNPNSTCSYQVLPGQMPAMYLAVTANSFSPNSADTTLAGELTSDGFARAQGTFAHTAAATTYTLTHTFTATNTHTINNEAVFGAANTTGGGVMPFESAEPNPPTLVNGDTLTQTITVTIN